MPTPTTKTLTHPIIGAITGTTATSNDENVHVTKYLGLQYATLANRFAPPQPKRYPQKPNPNESENESVDATRYGPQVLSLPTGAEHEFNLVQHSLAHDRDGDGVRMSDTEGLSLNVYVPATIPNADDEASTTTSTTADKKLTPAPALLPVLVFIHGGGFMGGSSSFPVNDLGKLVGLSAGRGKAVVGVSVNYRVGAPGFLHSAEMKQAGYQPNNAFRDQRTALLWVQEHISGFGGDPQNVTLMGESAGAVSTAVHLHSEQPLFRRAMLMSGSTLLKGPAPAERAEASYWRAVEVWGLGGMSSKERVESLVGMDGQQLRATLVESGVAPLVSAPSVDGDICPSGVDFKSVMDGSLELPGKRWCESLLLGDCAFDGSILGLPLGRRKPGIAKAFTTSISASLPSEPASRLLSSYGLTPETNDDEAFVKVLEFGGDVSFYAPTLAFAQGMEASMSVYMYRFNEPNPWPGPWQGRATHIHDLMLLLGNLNQFLSEEQVKLAEGFAESVIEFANGREPWQRWWSGEKVAKVLKVGDEGVKEDVPGQTERRGAFLELADEVGFDALKVALGKFIIGG